MWPGHYNNVGCSARLEISFELNLLPRVNKIKIKSLYFLSDYRITYMYMYYLDFVCL